MRKLFTLLLLSLFCRQASAQIYHSFNLDDFIAKHRIARSYDPISRCFAGSDRLRKRIASLTAEIALLNAELETLNNVQSKAAEIILDSAGSPDENSFWQNNRVQSDEAREIEARKLKLLDQKQQTEQLLTRDTGILGDIGDLASDIRASLSDKNAIYLNYLPAPEKTDVFKQWLSSPMQIFLWSPQEKYLADYLDNTYAVSLIFPESLRPVAYQKPIKGGNGQ